VYFVWKTVLHCVFQESFVLSCPTVYASLVIQFRDTYVPKNIAVGPAHLLHGRLCFTIIHGSSLELIVTEYSKFPTLLATLQHHVGIAQHDHASIMDGFLGIWSNVWSCSLVHWWPNPEICFESLAQNPQIPKSDWVQRIPTYIYIYTWYIYIYYTLWLWLM